MFTIIEVLTHLDMCATIAAELCTSWFVLPFCFKTLFTLQRIPRLWTSTIKNCIHITERTKEQRDAINITISEKIYFVKTRWHQIPKFQTRRWFWYRLREYNTQRYTIYILLCNYDGSKRAESIHSFSKQHLAAIFSYLPIPSTDVKSYGESENVIHCVLYLRH